MSSLGGETMIDTNQQLMGLLYEISALEPENDTAEAHAVYFRKIGRRWSQAALEFRGVKNG